MPLAAAGRQDAVRAVIGQRAAVGGATRGVGGMMLWVCGVGLASTLVGIGAAGSTGATGWFDCGRITGARSPGGRVGASPPSAGRLA